MRRAEEAESNSDVEAMCEYGLGKVLAVAASSQGIGLVTASAFDAEHAHVRHVCTEQD
jgi:hypothetical protein